MLWSCKELVCSFICCVVIYFFCSWSVLTGIKAQGNILFLWFVYNFGISKIFVIFQPCPWLWRTQFSLAISCYICQISHMIWWGEIKSGIWWLAGVSAFVMIQKYMRHLNESYSIWYVKRWSKTDSSLLCVFQNNIRYKYEWYIYIYIYIYTHTHTHRG